MNDLIDWRTEDCYFTNKELEGREVNFENIEYGILVEVKSVGGGYHTGMKVHFFNKKGVLVGNLYEFVPYNRIRFRNPYKGKARQYPKYFLDKPLQNAKQELFKILLKTTTKLIKHTQGFID